jgi:hypothetical protein
MFCGEANASTCASWAGHTVASVDIAKWDDPADSNRRAGKRPRAGKNPFDIMSTAGLGFPDLVFTQIML